MAEVEADPAKEAMDDSAVPSPQAATETMDDSAVPSPKAGKVSPIANAARKLIAQSKAPHATQKEELDAVQRRKREPEEDSIFGMRKMMRVLARKPNEHQMMLGLHALLAFTTIEDNLPKMMEAGVSEIIFDVLYTANDVPDRQSDKAKAMQAASEPAAKGPGGRRLSLVRKRSSSRNMSVTGAETGLSSSPANRRGSLVAGQFRERSRSHSPEDAPPTVQFERPRSSNPFERRASLLLGQPETTVKKKRKKRVMPPEVTTLLLQCLFNLSISESSHVKLITPDRMHIIAWFLDSENKEHRMLALRICINVSTSHTTHGAVCENLLQKITACAMPAKDALGGQTRNWGELQAKAFCAILNLSGNRGEAMAADVKVPSLPRMKLLLHGEIDELCVKHKIDQFSFPRFKLQQLLLEKRKCNVRHLVFEHKGLLDCLLFAIRTAPDTHILLALRILIKLSSDEDVVVDMVEAASDVTEPVVDIIRKILQPAADIIAGRVQPQHRSHNDEDHPVDPWMLARLIRMLKKRFETAFEVWVFYDKDGTWNVTSDDVLAKTKRLAPETDGLSREELLSIVDRKRLKVLDPHDFVRCIAWHDLPGDGKVVALSRALDEAKTRRQQIVERAVQFARKCREEYAVGIRQRRIQLRKEQMAARAAEDANKASQSLPGSPFSRKGQGERRKSTMQASVQALRAAMSLNSSPVAKSPKAAAAPEKANTKGLALTPLEIDDNDSKPSPIPTFESSAGAKAAAASPWTAPRSAASVASGPGSPHFGSPGRMSHASRAWSTEDGESPSSDDEEISAEDRKLMEEESRKIQMQRDLATFVDNLQQSQVDKMHLALHFFECLSTRMSNHEKLVLEVKLLEAIHPLIFIDEEPYGLKEVATRLQNEMGYELTASIEHYDPQTAAKMRVVTGKWLNGLLTAAFNTWNHSIRLQRYHTMTLLKVYGDNCQMANLPVNTGIAMQALQRFLSDATADRILAHSIGVNTLACRALCNTLAGRNLHGDQLPVLNVVELRHMESLQALAEIDISDNDIRDAGLSSLVACVVDTEMELTVLNVSSNHLTDAAGPMLAQVLQCCPIEDLKAAHNKLQAKGFLPMAEALQRHETLLNIHVNDNAIGRPAGQRLGAVLEENTVLEELDISWNDLTGEDGEALMKALLINRSVVSLSVSWNPLGPRVLPVLRELVNREPAILAFHMEQCGFDEGQIMPEEEPGEDGDNFK